MPFFFQLKKTDQFRFVNAWTNLDIELDRPESFKHIINFCNNKLPVDLHEHKETIVKLKPEPIHITNSLIFCHGEGNNNKKKKIILRDWHCSLDIVITCYFCYIRYSKFSIDIHICKMLTILYWKTLLNIIPWHV